MNMQNHPHPGEILRVDFLEPAHIEISVAAKRLGVSRTSLSRIVNGHTGISAEMAIRLERAGVSTARFWMNLQSNYALSLAMKRSQPAVLPLSDHPIVLRHVPGLKLD